MTKIRRANYVFLAIKTDHAPRHVHVYKNGKLVVKWDLEKERSMRGEADARLRALISQLQREGLL